MVTMEATMSTVQQKRDDAVECPAGVRSEAWVGLLQAHSALVKALDADLIARHRLSLSAFEVLLRLSQSEEGYLRMTDVAQQAFLSQSRISRLVDQLVGEGLVERRACSSDSRVVYACITDRGRELLEEAEATHTAGVEQRFLSRLSPAERDQLADIWRRILEPRP